MAGNDSPPSRNRAVKPSLSFFGLALIVTVVSAPAQQAGEDISFKVDVRLVSVLANVKDARGAPIPDLKVEDFSVLDGGEEVAIAVFERRTNRPLSVTLMIDTSLSTAKDLRFEREAARRFVNNLIGPDSQPEDQVAILQFSDYVDLLSDFTRSPQRLQDALNRTRPDSGTSMYDAVLLASQILEHRSGRRVVVVITDGGDTTSRIPFTEALEAAHDVDTVIYGIIVVPIQSDAGRNVGGENALKSLAGQTGGETFIQYGTADLDQAFREILRNLRTQYLIAYYPPPARTGRERFRRTEVRVNRPGATVLGRTGYFLPEEETNRPVSVPANISVQPPNQP